MKMSHTLENGTMVICLDGELDHHGAMELIGSICRAIESEVPARVCLDMSGVPFMDSSGIAVVMGTMWCAKEYSAGMRLIGVGQQPGKVLRAAGIERLMPLGQEMYI